MNWRTLLLSAIMALSLPARASGRNDLSGLQLAQTHLSAIITVQRWMRFAYGSQPSGSGGCDLVPTSLVPPPDGSATYSFSCEDGRYGSYTVWNDDGGATAALTYVVHDASPSQLVETIQAEVYDILERGHWSYQIFDVVHTLSTGDKMVYSRYYEEYSNSVTRVTWVGQLILTNGKRILFQFVQDRKRSSDALDLTLPGGDRLQLVVPTKDKSPWFDKEHPAVGSYTTRSSSIDFSITGDSSKYTNWDIADGQELRGNFRLTPDFAGKGQARRGERLEFVGRWDVKARGEILLANGQAAVAGPSAGAQDFGTARFIARIGELGPFGR